MHSVESIVSCCQPNSYLFLQHCYEPVIPQSFGDEIPLNKMQFSILLISIYCLKHSGDTKVYCDITCPGAQVQAAGGRWWERQEVNIRREQCVLYSVLNMTGGKLNVYFFRNIWLTVTVHC